MLIITILQVSPRGTLWIRGGGGSEFTLPWLMDNLVRHTSFVSALKGETVLGVWEILRETGPTLVPRNPARIHQAHQLSDETGADGTH